MEALDTIRPRAFAVLFKDLRLWSVRSFFNINWHWPPEYIKSLSIALRRRKEPVDRKKHSLESLQLATLRFDGSIEPRVIRKNEFKGTLHFANSGNVVYSKIDVRNGAIGIVPDNMPQIAVSAEYPVYEVLPDVAIPQYIQLLFRTKIFRQAINSMISGASGRKRVQPSQIEALEIPLPPTSVQQAIVAQAKNALGTLKFSQEALQKVTSDLNTKLFASYYADSAKDVLKDRWLVLTWEDLLRWDVKTARASAFRLLHPSYEPLGKFAEEATEMVKPWTEPEKEWPVYGVNNKEGVVFSHYQKGKDFNAPYKRIRKDWFFHNPTRSSVGSLGMVPDVPEDAITSPEYQVWRIKPDKIKEMLPGYVAVLINTPFFIKLIQFHRVGAVKQRLYVDNLLEIHVPVIPPEEQHRIATARETALKLIAEAEQESSRTESEIEALILGVKKLENI